MTDSEGTNTEVSLYLPGQQFLPLCVCQLWNKNKAKSSFPHVEFDVHMWSATNCKFSPRTWYSKGTCHWLLQLSLVKLVIYKKKKLKCSLNNKQQNTFWDTSVQQCWKLRTFSLSIWIILCSARKHFPFLLHFIICFCRETDSKNPTGLWIPGSIKNTFIARLYRIGLFLLVIQKQKQCIIL